MKTTYPPLCYRHCDDMWIITTYFNPAGYRTRRENYERFIAPIISSGIPLITVECAFGSEPFELEPAEHLIQVRGRNVLWVKERLINLALLALPPEAQKVAWVDNDILFCNPDWAVETSIQLDHYPCVQPFDCLHRLERGQTTCVDVQHFRRSFAYQWQHRPELTFIRGADYGHRGIAWAAQRDLIEKHGLYDAAILGGGDALFAHTLNGGLTNLKVRGITCAQQITSLPSFLERFLGQLTHLPWPRSLANLYVRLALSSLPRPASDEAYYAHYLRWACDLYADVRGQIGYTPGMALHLWHGNIVNRRYSARIDILKQHDFDPVADLRVNEDGVWEWASFKHKMHQEIREYFYSRHEDG